MQQYDIINNDDDINFMKSQNQTDSWSSSLNNNNNVNGWCRQTDINDNTTNNRPPKNYYNNIIIPRMKVRPEMEECSSWYAVKCY